MPPVEGISWGSAFLFLHSSIADIPNRLKTGTQNDAIKKHVFLSLFTPHLFTCVLLPGSRKAAHSPRATMTLSLAHEVARESSCPSPSIYGPWTVSDGIIFATPNQSQWQGAVANHWLVGSETVLFLGGGEGRHLDELHWCECVSVERHVEDSQCFCEKG